MTGGTRGRGETMTETERAICERAAAALDRQLPRELWALPTHVFLTVLVEEVAALKERVAELEARRAVRGEASE